MTAAACAALPLAAYDTWAWSANDLIAFLIAVVVGVPLAVLGAAWLSWPADGPSFWFEVRRALRRGRS